MKTIQEIAQWVIDNRYPKSENDKVSDAEMYHTLIEAMKQVLRQPPVSSSVCHCNELPNGEIAISSKALQKPYGDLGQTDC
jgi:hypothetical protein